MSTPEAFIASVTLFAIISIFINYSWRLAKGIIKDVLNGSKN